MNTVFVEKKDIGQVVKKLQHNQVVAFPTETVFGLGIRYDSLEALEALYQLKKRNKNKAITLMVPSIKEIEHYGEVNEIAQRMINTFMPGKITIILKKKATVDKRYTSNKETIGIRIPDDDFVLALLKQVGPMLVSSANRSGNNDLLTSKAVYDEFHGELETIVVGKAGSKTASTVVDVSEGKIEILRQGEITKEMLEEAIK